jgi:hypothetical protein
MNSSILFSYVKAFSLSRGFTNALMRPSSIDMTSASSSSELLTALLKAAAEVTGAPDATTGTGTGTDSTGLALEGIGALVSPPPALSTAEALRPAEVEPLIAKDVIALSHSSSDIIFILIIF